MSRSVVVLVLTVACGRANDSQPAAGSAAAAPAGIDVDRTVAAANALLPAELTSQVHFIKRTIKHHGHQFTLAAPEGWADDGAGNFERRDAPPHDGPPTFPSSLTVHAEACDGDWTGNACSAGGAALQADRGLFASITGDTTTDAASTATERRATVADKFATYAVRAWWSPHAVRFSYCVATLIDPLRPAVKAFTLACQNVRDEPQK